MGKCGGIPRYPFGHHATIPEAIAIAARRIAIPREQAPRAGQSLVCQPTGLGLPVGICIAVGLGIREHIEAEAGARFRPPRQRSGRDLNVPQNRRNLFAVDAWLIALQRQHERQGGTVRMPKGAAGYLDPRRFERRIQWRPPVKISRIGPLVLVVATHLLQQGNSAWFEQQRGLRHLGLCTRPEFRRAQKPGTLQRANRHSHGNSQTIRAKRQAMRSGGLNELKRRRHAPL
jgi:hypothetical protein